MNKTAPQILPGLPELLTAAQVAEMLQISSVTVYTLIKDGSLRGVPFHTSKAKRSSRGTVRILADDLRDFIQRCRTGGT